MSEPTKEAIEEADVLREVFCKESIILFNNDLARIIAHVRTQATNDALEVVRDIVDCVRFTSGSDDCPDEMVEQAANEMMRQIVDKKVPT